MFDDSNRQLDARRRLEHMKTMTLCPGEESRPFISMFGKDLGAPELQWFGLIDLESKRYWRAPCANSFLPYCGHTFCTEYGSRNS